VVTPAFTHHSGDASLYSTQFAGVITVMNQRHAAQSLISSQRMPWLQAAVVQ
jgi:hypothetical protein